jgi:hypothetical protein
MISVTQRVQLTSAKDKLLRFRLILTEEIKFRSISDSEFKETFLDLILRINEDQIKILNAYKKIKLEKIGLHDNVPGIGIVRIKHPGKNESDYAKIRTHEYFGIDDELYKFYVQDLISKSLLYDDGLGLFGSRPFLIIEITQFGMAFLNYIDTVDLEHSAEKTSRYPSGLEYLEK